MEYFYIFFMDDLYQQIYDDTYEGILNSLQTRSKNIDFSFNIVKEELDSLYKYEGLGWTGRGDLKQAEIEGTILAFEVFIMQYKNSN